MSTGCSGCWERQTPADKTLHEQPKTFLHKDKNGQAGTSRRMCVSTWSTDTVLRPAHSSKVRVYRVHSQRVHRDDISGMGLLQLRLAGQAGLAALVVLEEPRLIRSMQLRQSTDAS